MAIGSLVAKGKLAVEGGRGIDNLNQAPDGLIGRPAPFGNERRKVPKAPLSNLEASPRSRRTSTRPRAA